MNSLGKQLDKQQHRDHYSLEHQPCARHRDDVERSLSSHSSSVQETKEKTNRGTPQQGLRLLRRDPGNVPRLALHKPGVVAQACDSSVWKWRPEDHKLKVGFGLIANLKSPWTT